MPLLDFRAHATWQTCLSSYAVTFLTDEPRLRSAAGCIRRCRRLSRGCKPTREDSPRFCQLRAGEVVRATGRSANHFSRPLLFVPAKSKLLRQSGSSSAGMGRLRSALIVVECATNLASVRNKGG